MLVQGPNKISPFKDWKSVFGLGRKSTLKLSKIQNFEFSKSIFTKIQIFKFFLFKIEEQTLKSHLSSNNTLKLIKKLFNYFLKNRKKKILHHPNFFEISKKSKFEWITLKVQVLTNKLIYYTHIGQFEKYF
jgi:hypothetical protein